MGIDVCVDARPIVPGPLTTWGLGRDDPASQIVNLKRRITPRLKSPVPIAAGTLRDNRSISTASVSYGGSVIGRACWESDIPGTVSIACWTSSPQWLLASPASHSAYGQNLALQKYTAPMLLSSWAMRFVFQRRLSQDTRSALTAGR